jgi:GNAT superfamily N-acetyltransferase
MTDAEVDFMAARLKPLLMEGLIWLAEAGDEPVGFLLALPDYNVALKPLKGRLLTPKLLGFIPYLLGWKCPPRTRIITLGVKDKYRGKGLESAMLIEGLKVGISAGVRESEASWILEDNVMMCRVLEAIGLTHGPRGPIFEFSWNSPLQNAHTTPPPLCLSVLPLQIVPILQAYGDLDLFLGELVERFGWEWAQVVFSAPFLIVQVQLSGSDFPALSFNQCASDKRSR